MQDEIKHLKIRSRDAKLWNLSSSTFLEEASQDLAKVKLRLRISRSLHRSELQIQVIALQPQCSQSGALYLK